MVTDPLFDVTGKVVVITGSGTGLGACLAHAFAARGAHVVVSGRTVEAVQKIRDDIVTTGGSAVAVAFDARSRTSCEELFQTTLSNFGEIHMVVVNHGLGHGCAAEDITEADWDALLQTNVTGAFHCVQLAGRHMLQQPDGGSIVLVGSTAGVVAFPNLLAYATTKAAVLQIARQLAAEWGDRGIRVNAVCPGYMDHMMKGTENRYSGEEVEEHIRLRTPMRRRGSSEELVGTVLFLASKASSFVTGQVICVDGGYTLV